MVYVKLIFIPFSLVSHCVIHYMWFAGASSGAIDLLPSPSTTTNWTAGLLMDSNDIIFKFDGKQGAKIPDGIVPKNLTDQFTITLWMKHGPSPGLRAEKETILCNSDKTGETVYGKKCYSKGESTAVECCHLSSFNLVWEKTNRRRYHSKHCWIESLLRGPMAT